MQFTAMQALFSFIVIPLALTLATLISCGSPRPKHQAKDSKKSAKQSTRMQKTASSSKSGKLSKTQRTKTRSTKSSSKSLKRSSRSKRSERFGKASGSLIEKSGKSKKFEEELRDLKMEPVELRWNTSGGMQKVFITNPTNIRRAVKVKCSDNNLYRVNPVYSFVEPGQVLCIDIVRQNGGAKVDKMVFVAAKILIMLWIIKRTMEVRCYTNVAKGETEEDCGPEGNCYIMREAKVLRPYEYVTRGCDFTFFCEVLRQAQAFKYEPEFNLSGHTPSNAEDEEEEYDYEEEEEEKFSLSGRNVSNITLPEEEYDDEEGEEKFTLSGPKVSSTPEPEEEHDEEEEKDDDDDDEESYDIFGCIPDTIFPDRKKKIFKGYMCCCNFDFCNMAAKNEPVTFQNRLESLGNGSVEEYQELLQIKKDFEIKQTETTQP